MREMKYPNFQESREHPGFLNGQNVREKARRRRVHGHDNKEGKGTVRETILGELTRNFAVQLKTKDCR